MPQKEEPRPYKTVRIEFMVNDEYRRAINMFYGQPGLATWEEVRAFLLSYGKSMDDDLPKVDLSASYVWEDSALTWDKP